MTTIIHFDTEKRKRERLVEREQKFAPTKTPWKWGDPEKCIAAFRAAIEDPAFDRGVARLHPEDQVDVLRRVAAMCTMVADAKQKHIDRHGVPDKQLSPAAAEAEARAVQKPTLVDDVKRAVREVNHDPTMVVGMDQFGKPVRASVGNGCRLSAAGVGSILPSCAT